MSVSVKFTSAFAILCLVYLLSNPYLGPALSAAFKILPILTLGWLIVSNKLDSVAIHLLAAVTFSMGGDILLELGYFVTGLVSFLIAQINYATLFARFVKDWTGRPLLTLLVIAFSITMGLLLWNATGDLRVPVMAYLVVISLMGITANVTEIRGVFIGAASFILSDSFIAINRFLLDLPASGWLVMVTYYLAQFILVTSVVKARCD